MHFRILGLPAEQFAPLFAMSDAALAERGAVRRIADARERGYPCRVSLANSKPGDELILVNYEHHAVASPYRMRFAIYVRNGDETFDAIDTVPEQLRGRTLAVRAFDADGMMAGWDLVEGDRLEGAIARLLAEPRIRLSNSRPHVVAELQIANPNPHRKIADTQTPRVQSIAVTYPGV